MRPPILNVGQYGGAKVIDPQGALVGEVTGTSGDTLDLALGGWRDAWGFVTLSPGRHVATPAAALAFGPPRAIGMKLVMVSTTRDEVVVR